MVSNLVTMKDNSQNINNEKDWAKYTMLQISGLIGKLEILRDLLKKML